MKHTLTPGWSEYDKLRLLECSHEVVTLDYKDVTTRKDSPELRRLQTVNPLAQFPTLVTPEGGVMTETAAISLYLNERHGRDSAWSISSLAPRQLAAFYRWMVYVPANIYPAVTIVEFPERYISVPEGASVSQDEAQKWVAAETSKRREDAWKLLENNLQGGLEEYSGGFALKTDEPTLLDIYLTLLAHWTPFPRYKWFKTNCPMLYHIAVKTVNASDVVREVFLENDLDAFMGKEMHARKLDLIP